MSLAQQNRVFDAFFIAMVRVGEMTGRLDVIFMQLFKHIEFDVFMRQQVKSAVRYPMFVGIAMAIAMGVINIMVIPAFATVFKGFGAELPLATRILLATSNFTLQWGWLLAIGAVGAFLALRSWIATAPGAYAWTTSACASRWPARSCRRPRWRAWRAASRWPSRAASPSSRP